ncbi:MAG: MBL fold metallo-hydrolase [Acidimicrobiia bacterium]
MDGTCEIYGFLIHHPDGKLLVDTGVADDHPAINDLYRPTVVPIVTALNEAGVDERDITGLINTHLHFDHCGQNRALARVPVWVQAAEMEASLDGEYTIAEWAHLDSARQRLVSGDVQVAEGVWLITTPGHSPGHQSVLVEEDADRRALIVGQCCYNVSEFSSGEIPASDMHDESLLETGRESLDRLRSLRPDRAFFSHDSAVFEAHTD